MPDAPVLTVATGFVAGLLSGAFGVGGGIMTTPAIRLLLGYPELVAVGTPLPVIVPTAIVGAISYARFGLADIRAGVTLGLWGSAAAVIGAWFSDLVGGTVVLLVTAGVIGYMAIVTFQQAFSNTRDRSVPYAKQHPHRGVALAVLGMMTGLYSGFLGLGGGFVIVPMLRSWFGYDIKRAIGTSLVAIGVLAVPGAFMHWWLGHVDISLALTLAVGVVPGAFFGAWFTSWAQEHFVTIAFALLLGVVGVLLAASELGVI